MAEAVAVQEPIPSSESTVEVSRSVRIALYISSWSLIFAGYLSLATVRTIGIPILLIPILQILLTPFAEKLDKQWIHYPTLTRAVAITYLCFIPLSIIVSDLTTAVIALIIFIQFLLLFHQKNEKEYLILFLMSFFLLLSSCVQSPESGIALAMVLFLISAIWAFFSLRIFVEEQESRALTAPELVPLDKVNLGADSVTPSLFDRGLVGIVFTMSCVAMLLTIVVFLFIPRIEAGLFGRSPNDVAVSDISDTVNLDGGDYLQMDNSPVMVVSFPRLSSDESLDMESLYWRAATMSLYMPSGWTRGSARTPLDPRYISSGGQSVTGQLNSQAIFQVRTNKEIFRLRRDNTDSLYYTIFMSEIPSISLPVLDSLYRIKLNSSERRMSVHWEAINDNTVDLQRAKARHLDFEGWSEIDTISTDVLAAADGDIKTFWIEEGYESSYEIHTTHDLLPSTETQIAAITENASTPYQKAKALENWFKGSDFTYTLDLPFLPDSHRMDAFITEIRTGHCELFATAMALSLRSLGIPTRVVSGYQGAEADSGENSFIVRKNMAHLWVEAWIPDCGWIRFDPTPSGDLSEIGALQRMTLLYSRQRLKAQMLWYREVVGFSGGVQLGRLKDFSLGFFKDITLPGDSEEGSSRSQKLFPLFILLLSITLLSAAFLLRRKKRNKAPGVWNLSDDQQRSIQLYRALRNKLRRLGLPHTGDTAGDLLQNLADSQHAPLEAVQSMLRIYNEVRFGHRPLTTERYTELLGQLKRLHPNEQV